MKTIKKNVSHKKKLSRKKEIYRYGRKRNNSRLKMKNNIKSKNNIKRKRSILRGGALTTLPWRRSSKKFSNVEKNENTALKEYIFVKKQYLERTKSQTNDDGEKNQILDEMENFITRFLEEFQSDEKYRTRIGYFNKDFAIDFEFKSIDPQNFT